MNELELGIYEHYKGRLYEVIGVGLHTETKPLEKFVIYQQLYATEKFKFGTIWIRPLEMFLGKIKINEKNIKRFKRLPNESRPHA
jgi:hypothetical protein